MRNGSRTAPRVQLASLLLLVVATPCYALVGALTLLVLVTPTRGRRSESIVGCRSRKPAEIVVAAKCFFRYVAD